MMIVIEPVSRPAPPLGARRLNRPDRGLVVVPPRVSSPAATPAPTAGELDSPGLDFAGDQVPAVKLPAAAVPAEAEPHLQPEHGTVPEPAPQAEPDPSELKAATQPEPSPVAAQPATDGKARRKADPAPQTAAQRHLVVVVDGAVTYTDPAVQVVDLTAATNTDDPAAVTAALMTLEQVPASQGRDHVADTLMARLRALAFPQG